MRSGDKPLTPEDIAAASPHPLVASESTLDAQQRAALSADVAWVDRRADFRRKMVASGVMNRPWRSIFEADMILSIIAHRWLTGRLITHKELATYFELFATEATVSRHVTDMEEAGMIVRQIDPEDRRRILLVPTERLEVFGREFLQARIDIMRDHGFAWTGGAETDRKTASDPA